METTDRTIMQIAESCDVRYNDVMQVVKKERIIGKLRIENNKKYFTIHQQDLIYRVLYFEGKTDFFVIPSKLNTMNYNQ